MRRVIVDECLPRKLKNLMPGVDALTVPEAGFAGVKNGMLLSLIKGRFDAFVTIDANLEDQQNLKDLSFGIVVIHAKSNRYVDIEPMKEWISDAVLVVLAGQIVHIPPQT